MQRCSCCKARLADSAQCPRCGTDLSYCQAASAWAKTRLAEAIDYSQTDEMGLCLQTLQQSLLLEATPLARQLLDFFVERESRKILQLLAEKQILPARHKLQVLKNRFPNHELILQMHAYADYLSLNSPSQAINHFQSD